MRGSACGRTLHGQIRKFVDAGDSGTPMCDVSCAPHPDLLDPIGEVILRSHQDPPRASGPGICDHACGKAFGQVLDGSQDPPRDRAPPTLRFLQQQQLDVSRYPPGKLTAEAGRPAQYRRVENSTSTTSAPPAGARPPRWCGACSPRDRAASASTRSDRMEHAPAASTWSSTSATRAQSRRAAREFRGVMN